MFTETQAVFFYAVTPVHMGSGNAVGVIDNPIQRERHTEHPCLAGSGLKGALRHRWRAEAKSDDDTRLMAAIFGPEKNAGDFAGAVSLSDAQLVLFPVRATRKAFVYATCCTALARALRSLTIAGVACGWKVPPEPGEGKAWITGAGTEMLHPGYQLGLEWFAYTAESRDEVAAAAAWLAGHALPAEHGYFADHLKKYLVVLPDEDFGFFVRHSTSVEPHVRINDESGTADGTGLFYTENLPPESLLLSLVMASQERTATGKNHHQNGHAAARTAVELQAALRDRTHGKLLQIGGDATTGRGHVIPAYVGVR